MIDNGVLQLVRVDADSRSACYEGHSKRTPECILYIPRKFGGYREEVVVLRMRRIAFDIFTCARLHKPSVLGEPSHNR